MKKKLLLSALLTGVMAVQADDYPYLTFETADGTKTSVSTSSLTISIDNGTLTAGEQSFTLTNLSKMYFSQSQETTGVSSVDAYTSDDQEYYDLQGRKVSKSQLRRGTYIVKSKKGTLKINIK